MKKYLVGIDEVGRGPIAGPVAVGAFVFLDPKAIRMFRGVKESKQLTEKEREAWFEVIQDARKKGLIDFKVSFQSERSIDAKGLTYTITKALTLSLNGLKLDPESVEVRLDGGLKAPPQYMFQKTIIRGDAREKVIALASICAKVLRDRKMNRWGKKYPKYGFEVHKGYGTRKHYEALEKEGILPLHRRSFLQKRGL